MVLEIRSLTKRFPGFQLGPLSLRVQREILVIIGPTGSGKTTTLNLIAGLIMPDQGSIKLDGVEITQHPPEARRVGYVFQSPFLFPHLNVYGNVIFGLTGRERQARSVYLGKLLQDIGIAELSDRSVKGLSGGEMQKVALARMLAVEPSVILLDEPLSHLDPPARRRLRGELRRILKKHGVPAVYVTHSEEDVYGLADSIAVLRDGVVEYQGALHDALSSTSSAFASEMLTSGNYIEGTVIESVGGLTRIKAGVHILEMLGDHGVGSRVAISLRPEEVLLSKEPSKTSARNIIMGEVGDIEERSRIPLVRILADSLQLTARVTEAALNELGIKKGDHVYAIFKATSPQVVREE